MITLASAGTVAPATLETATPVADAGYGFFDDDIPTFASAGSSATVVNSATAPNTAASVNKTSKSNEGNKETVKIHEEVGYGLFATEGKENEEEGYGFFAPFQPHPDAAVATLIGDDTATH